jgi:hypothetical protein
MEEMLLPIKNFGLFAIVGVQHGEKLETSVLGLIPQIIAIFCAM